MFAISVLSFIMRAHSQRAFLSAIPSRRSERSQGGEAGQRGRSTLTAGASPTIAGARHATVLRMRIAASPRCWGHAEDHASLVCPDWRGGRCSSSARRVKLTRRIFLMAGVVIALPIAKLDAVNNRFTVLARRSRVIAHRRAARRNGDFGVTHCRGIGAVHTGREWAGFRRMGAMQAAQPVQATGRMLPPRPLKSFTAHVLRGRLVETR